ncbi:MAG TPA: hypothetical protein VJT31_38510, partial [Rugosimonospora sp.]|nr:hypothetical protein [Rugosimonospora sp.]
ADVARADAKGDPPPDLQVSLRWNLRTGAVERIPGIVARAVSASGRIAGVASTGAAAYWQSGRLFTLPGTAYAALAGVTADGHTFAGDAATGTGPVRSDGSQAPGNAVPAVWRGC